MTTVKEIARAIEKRHGLPADSTSVTSAAEAGLRLAELHSGLAYAELILGVAGDPDGSFEEESESVPWTDDEDAGSDDS